jgi:hypothetical protein
VLHSKRNVGKGSAWPAPAASWAGDG